MNGTLSYGASGTKYDPIGCIVFGATPTDTAPIGSCILVGPSTVLTISHNFATTTAGLHTLAQIGDGNDRAVRFRRKSNGTVGNVGGEINIASYRILQTGGGNNVIAVATLASPVTWITPMSMASAAKIASAYVGGASVTIAGWGKDGTTDNTGSYPFDVMMIDTTIVAGPTSRIWHVGTFGGQVGVNTGDSGGAMFYDDGGTLRLLGIVNASSVDDATGPALKRWTQNSYYPGYEAPAAGTVRLWPVAYGNFNSGFGTLANVYQSYSGTGSQATCGAAFGKQTTIQRAIFGIDPFNPQEPGDQVLPANVNAQTIGATFVSVAAGSVNAPGVAYKFGQPSSPVTASTTYNTLPSFSSILNPCFTNPATAGAAVAQDISLSLRTAVSNAGVAQYEYMRVDESATTQNASLNLWGGASDDGYVDVTYAVLSFSNHAFGQIEAGLIRGSYGGSPAALFGKILDGVTQVGTFTLSFSGGTFVSTSDAVLPTPNKTYTITVDDGVTTWATFTVTRNDDPMSPGNAAVDGGIGGTGPLFGGRFG